MKSHESLKIFNQHPAQCRYYVYVHICMYVYTYFEKDNWLWGTESQPEFSNTDLRFSLQGALRSIYLFYNLSTVNNLKVYVHILVTELTNIPHKLLSS